MKRRHVVPIADGLTAADFLRLHPPAHPTILVTYRCPNRHAVELPLPRGPVLCERCGSRMKLVI